MIRVVVADDHPIVREGIRALLEKAGDMEVVGEAADGQEAIKLVQCLLPQVLVIDLAMPRLNGIEAISRIGGLGLKTRILILSMFSDDILVRQAFRYGASGYLTKLKVDELIVAVRAVARGDTFISPEVSGSLLKGI